jgi:hypothetical protein
VVMVWFFFINNCILEQNTLLASLALQWFSAVLERYIIFFNLMDRWLLSTIAVGVDGIFIILGLMAGESAVQARSL